MAAQTILHASCISIGGHGVLIMGASGSGKSDLALRLIDMGATLVADDQVVIEQNEMALLASPAPRLEGLLEVRGVGILRLPHAGKAPITLAVQLLAAHEVERMPAPQFFDCLGQEVPLLSLHAFESSTAAKIRLFLASQPIH